MQIGDNMLCLNDLQALIVSFYDRKFSFISTRQRSQKTGISDSKMIQHMAANYSKTSHAITILIHSSKTRFQNVFITLLRT